MNRFDLFHSGTEYAAYEYMGAHHIKINKRNATVFRVWAPLAKNVSVVGCFNSWDKSKNPMKKITDAGIWECLIYRNISEYSEYKYNVQTFSGQEILKADPYAFHAETRPQTASKIYDIDSYTWCDNEWIQKN